MLELRKPANETHTGYILIIFIQLTDGLLSKHMTEAKKPTKTTRISYT